MKIVQLAAEFAPIAKVGGLGEVVVGLSRELSRLGETVDVIIPKYDFIDVRKLSHIKMEIPDFKCLEKGNLHANTMWSATAEECNIHLLESRHPAGYFHREKIYGCEDDAARFLYFSRACLEYLKLKNEPIDILHLHDWHVAAAAVLAKDLFHLPIKAIVLTIHNAEYQGQCATWDLDGIGLKGAEYLVKEKLQDDDPARPKTICLLKGGIVYSDAVVAVSPTYAKEILTSEMGAHIDATLRRYKAKVSGILNGIDQKLWDPMNDKALPVPFGKVSSFSAIEAAKQAARTALQKQFGLAPNHRPWIGAITRLVPQKGPELLEQGLRHTLTLNGSFLLLGSSPFAKTQEHFDEVQLEFADNKQTHLHFEFDDELSRKLYAALDFLFVPSLYEPCGLTQLIAMRYGTIPIARATGGLRDTVFDCEDPSVPVKERNGILFQQPTAAAANEAIERAIRLFRSEPTTVQALIRRGMQLDSSWKKPTQEHLRLFQNLMSKKKTILENLHHLPNAAPSQKPKRSPEPS